MNKQKPMTVGELKIILSEYPDNNQVALWVKTKLYNSQTYKWRYCEIRGVEPSNEGLIICQEWKDDYDG